MAKKFDAKAKAKRQKIIAAVLGLVLLGALAWAVPSVLSSMNKKPPAASAVAAPPPATTPPAGAAPTGTPVSAAAPAGTLADSDPPAQAAAGQLLSFDRFESKDPFAQQATTPAKPASPSEPAGAVNTATPKRPPPPPPPPTADAKPSTAKISVNGETEEVSVGAAFPTDDPVFQLVSLTSNSAKVSIAGGSLSSGAATVTLTKGKKVTLMNTADGTRYDLLLVSVG
jgi:hypothetical protein